MTKAIDIDNRDQAEMNTWYEARIEALQRTVKEQAQEIERLRERERSAGLR